MMFQTLKVVGSYKDLGRAIGTTFGDKIRDRINKRREKIPKYQDYLSKTTEYFEITRKNFPNLILETERLQRLPMCP